VIATGQTHIRTKLAARKVKLDIGMTLYHGEITRTVDANRKYIVSSIGIVGIYTDQLSVKNLYHFFDGRKTHDARMQILDSYLQILDRPVQYVTLN